MKKLIICLLITFMVQASFAENISLEKSDQEKTKQIIHQFKEIITMNDPKIVFIGEDHRDLYAKKLGVQVIMEYAKESQKKTCVFLEKSISYRPAFDLLNQYKITQAMNTYYESWQKKSEYNKKRTGKPFSDWTNWTALQDMVFQHIKVYPVDIEYEKSREDKIISLFAKYDKGLTTIPEMKKFDQLLITDRNEAMAANIKDILTSAEYDCEIAFFPVETRHLYRKAGLPEILKHNFTTVELFLQERSKDYHYRKECSDFEKFHVHLCIDMDM